MMQRCRSRFLARLTETPLELTVALIAVATGSFRIVGDLKHLSAYAIWFWLVLIAGGGLYVWGRLRPVIDDVGLDIQSAGLAFIIAGFAFSTIRALGTTDSVSDYVLRVFIYVALASGLGLRLWAVRKARRGCTEAAL